MWGWSPEARSALSGGHTAVSRVDVWHAGKPVYTLAVVGGSVSVDADRPVRSNLSCRLVDPTGQLSRGAVGDLLNAYECEIAPYRGVRISTTSTTVSEGFAANAGFGSQPFGSSGFGGVESTPLFLSTTTVRDELAPLGVFGLTGRSVSDGRDGLTISLTGQDRAMGFQTPMSRALPINAGTPVEAAIQQLLGTVQSGLSLLAMRTGFTVGPLLFQPDIDVWAEAQKLAQSVGARLFHDRTGQVVLAPAGAVSDRPVAAYAEGDGRLLDVNRAEDSDTIKNVVRAENADGSIAVTVEDDDPTSPTYSRGRYGRRVFTFKNPYFGSVQQAKQAATTRLAYELGRSETVDFTAVPDPGLDVDEVVLVNRPRSGLTHRGLVLATLDIPLGASESMKVGCRQSRFAQDGRLLVDPKEAAA